MNDKAACPAPERIAEFLDGRLEMQERDLVESHLASCPDCYEVFRGAVQFQSEERRRQPLFRAFAKPAALGALAAALLLAIGIGVVRRKSAARPGMAELVAAVGRERPFEARLTGGFSYGPVTPVFRSAEGPEKAPWKVLAAAAQIRERNEREGTPRSLGDQGAAELLLGEWDQAVADLEDANRRDASDARLSADLSAALLVRAQRKDRPQDLSRALEAAERAARLDPGSREALFNRALALEAMHLPNEARKAWKGYLLRETSGDWAKEAREREARLSRRPNVDSLWPDKRRELLAAAGSGDRAALDSIVSDHAQAARESMESQELSAWARAALAGDLPAAEAELRILKSVAASLERVSGDPFLSEAVSPIESAAQSRDPRSVAPLARGVSELGEAERLYLDRQPAAAIPHWESALPILETLDRPLALSARLLQAATEFNKGNLDAMASRLEVLEPLAEKAGYRSVLARSLWMRALRADFDERIAEAIPLYLRAARLFEQGRESRFQGRLELILESNFHELGDSDRSERHRLAALAAAERHPFEGSIREGLLSEALQDLDDGRVDLADHLVGEVLSREGPADRLARAQALTVAGGIFARRHEPAASRRAFEQARRELRPGDAVLRDRLESEIDVTEAESELPNRASLHLARLPGLFEKFHRAGLDSRDSELFLIQGRAREALGDLSAARRDYEEGIRRFEKERLLEGDWQVSYFDRSWDLFRRAIALAAFRQRDPGAALGLIERSRGRSLPPRQNDASAGPLDPERIRAELPSGSTLLYYGVFEDRLLIWRLSRAGLQFAAAPIGENELRSLVESVRSGFSSSVTSRVAEASARLYDLLIRPVEAGLPARETLVLVPDGPLHRLPFAAMTDSRSGRLLIEDHPLSIAASGTSFVNSRRDAAGGSMRFPSALFAEGPSGRDVDGTELAPLPGIGSERDSIVRAFAGAEVLSGERATASRFLMEAASHELVFFAGHALAGSTRPGLARLMLFPDVEKAGAGALFAGEISKRDLSAVRLVVLSACDTGVGSPARTEGPASLARAFLQAGAREVIATLTPLSDARAGELWESLAAGLASGQPTAEALRNAQLSVIRTQRKKETGSLATTEFVLYVGGRRS